VRILSSGELHCSNQCEESDVERSARLALQGVVAEVARALGPALPAGIGFVVILSDFGNTGGMAYASSIDREGSISMMQELVDKMRHDQAVAEHLVDTTIAKAVGR
jgi:hypothetical protein